MNSVRLVASVILGIVATYVIVLNWTAPILWLTKKKHMSWVPLFGGIAGAGAIAMAPLTAIHQFWWIPLVADWGTLPGLLVTLFGLMRRVRK